MACIYSIWLLIDAFCRRPDDRLRIAGLFCFLGGVGSLAFSIGVGRAFAGPRAGFLERYMTLGAPLLFFFYLQFTLYSSAAVKIHLQRTLALLMCSLLVVNVHKGLGYAYDFKQLSAALEADMRAGLPSADLALRHGEDLGFASNEVFAARLEMLRKARLGPYREEGEKTAASLTVRRLQELVPSREPTHELTLLPGHSFTQYFQVPDELILSRIDVEISRCRRGRTSDRVNWALYAVAANQPKRLVADNTIDT